MYSFLKRFGDILISMILILFLSPLYIILIIIVSVTSPGGPFFCGERIGKNGKPFKTVPARTNYKILEHGPTHALFELSLDTGKKNQIRAHLAAHDYILAGDEDHRARTDHFHRLCLHARTLEFDHPFTQEHMVFEVPEPDEWVEYVTKGGNVPEKPLWDKSFENGKKAGAKKEELKLGEKRLSRKDKAHMNFIESGKRYR